MKSRILLIIAAAIALASCSNRSEYRRAEGSVWTTEFHIVYRADRPLDDSIQAVLTRVEQSLSPFAEGSLISRINRGETRRADSLILRVLTRSQQICRLSGGAFDPTVSPLVNLWGFGFKNLGREPLPAEIDSARSLVGIGRVAVRGDELTIPIKGMEFNFSAITKGYAVDLIGEMLRRNGSEDYMVEIGGEVACRGKNPRGDSWQIQIDSPQPSSAAAHDRMAVVALTDCAIATSGNYRRFRQSADGSRAWHTIDPTTGRPALSNTLSATVIAPDCMTADALATAAMVLTADSALRMIDRVPGASALLVTAGPDSTLQTLTSPGFPPLR